MVLISKKVAAGFHRIPMGSAVFRVGSFCCLKVQQKNAWGDNCRVSQDCVERRTHGQTIVTHFLRSALVQHSLCARKSVEQNEC